MFCSYGESHMLCPMCDIHVLCVSRSSYISHHHRRTAQRFTQKLMEERRHIVRNITLNDKYNIKEAIARAQADARIADAITNRSEDATIPSAIARARHDQHQEAQRQVQIKHDVLVQKLYRWWARDPWGYVDASSVRSLFHDGLRR